MDNVILVFNGLASFVIGFIVGRIYQNRIGRAMVYVPESIPLPSPTQKFNGGRLEEFDDDFALDEESNYDEIVGRPRKISMNSAYGKIGRPLVHVLLPLPVDLGDNHIVFRNATPLKIQAIFLWGDRDVIVKSVKINEQEQLAGGEAPIQVFGTRGRTYEQLQKELVDYNTIVDAYNIVLPGMTAGDTLDIEFECGNILTAAIWYSTYHNS